MENIFENAFFGKAYKTSDGNKALYSTASIFDKNVHWLLTQGGMLRWYSDGTPYGETSNPIVAEWQEPIDEEELGELAEEFANRYSIQYTQQSSDLQCGFKAGYRAALKQ